MNIKSLLLGSAAALVAVSGARAADAVVVAEPEPVEYVRVCDVYGAGFFYIPGTETCLAISGYVWYQIGADSRGIDRDPRPTGAFVDRVDAWAKSVRARVNFDARSETEWGTLRGYIRMQADWDTQNQIGVVYDGPSPADAIGIFNYGGDGVVRLDQAWLSLGGLQMGYTESAWAVSFNGGATNWGSHSWGGLSYGYQQRHQISYTFQGGNGFFGTLSLEDDGNSNFMPDIVAKVGLTQGWGAVWAKVAYDEDIAPASNGAFGERLLPLSGVDGWAASLGAQINVPNMPGSSLRLIGFYANNANAYSAGALGWGGRWSVLASYNHVFSPKLSASVGLQYTADTNFATAGSPSRFDAELSIVAVPVQNFEIRTEITYTKPSTTNGYANGFLRFTRYF